MDETIRREAMELFKRGVTETTDPLVGPELRRLCAIADKLKSLGDLERAKVAGLAKMSQLNRKARRRAEKLLRSAVR